MKLKTILSCSLIVVFVSAPLGKAICFEPCEAQTECAFYHDSYCMTSKYWFEAESVSGASGDVVGVTFTLHAATDFDVPIPSVELAVCHDPLVAELVGGPVYSEEILERNPIQTLFFPVDEGSEPDAHSGHGFLGMLIGLERIPVPRVLPLLTVYYRLMGDPGESSEISFCDGSLILNNLFCTVNGVRDWTINDRLDPLLSTRNLSGTLSVRDGPVTRPERPPEPPEAQVYAETPSSEEVNLRVRIGNALAMPGEREVPVDVFVTADVEYTGVIVPVDFDERYLRVARVEDNFLAGKALVDNEDSMSGAQADEGYAVIASSIVGTRRIAPVGEEFHAATIFFDVLDTAAEISETALEVRRVGGRVPEPTVAIRHHFGTGADPVAATSEIGAVAIAHGVMALRASTDAERGDANLDGRFDISDPVAVLDHLFLGQEQPLCLAAADYDGDGRLGITDAIRMLGVLFQGGRPPATAGGDRVDCR
jgi:hypothetical protein